MYDWSCQLIHFITSSGQKKGSRSLSAYRADINFKFCRGSKTEMKKEEASTMNYTFELKKYCQHGGGHSMKKFCEEEGI